MLGQSTLGIGMTMFLRDQFSGPASKIRASAGMISQDLRKMQEEQLRHARNLNAGVALMGAAALRGMGRAVDKAAEFGYEMEFVKSITRATGVEQKKLGDLAKSLAGGTMFFPKDIAEGMRFMAMAGMEVPDVMQNITGAVNLAGATMAQLGGKGGAADVMTNIMKQFKIDFKNSTDVADQLSYAVTRSNTNLFDLGEALKYAGSTSMDLNISLQESTAMVMALGNAGMQGSMAGVAMENSMRYMARAFSSFGSGTSRKALAMVGMELKDVTDQAGNLISMTEIMKKMGNAIQSNFGQGMNLEKQAVLQAIFGVRGKRAASLLLRNIQEFDRFTGDISTKSAGHSGKIMSDMMSTLKGEQLKLASQWQSTWISFTQAIAPTLTILLQTVRSIAKALQWVFDSRLGTGMAAGIAGFITFRTVASAFRAVVYGIKLVMMQSTGAMATLAGTTVSGYGAMTAAAAAYSNTVRAGAMAGRSQYGIMAHAAGRGKIRGITTNTAGRLIAKKTGRYVGAATAGAVYAGAGRMVGGAFVKSSTTRMILGKIVGFLGGPIGMALSFILPAAIGMLVKAIGNNKDKTEENTRALQDERRTMATGGVQYAHALQFLDDYNPKLQALAATSTMGTSYKQAQIQTDFQNTLMQNLSKLVGSAGPSGTGDLVLILDGDEVLRSPIEKYLSKQFNGLGY